MSGTGAARTARATAVALTLSMGVVSAEAPGTTRSASPPPRPVFAAQLELVYATVTVRDPQGRIVPDLPASAFEVREDGHPREVQVFARGPDQAMALDVALLLDTSGSMEAEMDHAQHAALDVLERIPLLRRRTVVSFDTDIRFWRTDGDPSSLLAQMRAARAHNGASAIRSALVAALEALAEEGSGRGALILLSDGVDVGSPVTETQLIRAIESSNVTIYPLPFTPSSFAPVPSADLRRGPPGRLRTFPSAPDTSAGRGFLGRLATVSGGRLLGADGRFEHALDGLVEELSSQYVIGFAPSDAGDGRSHHLEVRLPGRHLDVRYRSHYRTP